MTRMKYTCSVAMGPIDQLIDIAKTAEEVGFDSIALPDSLFYMEQQAADYPYTPDGSRMWNADTPWVDPLIAAGAMGADKPFEFQAVCIDKFGVDGHRELADAGVTDNIVIPWIVDGLGFDAPLEKKKDSLKRFADTYINSGWQQ